MDPVDTPQNSTKGFLITDNHQRIWLKRTKNKMDTTLEIEGSVFFHFEHKWEKNDYHRHEFREKSWRRGESVRAVRGVRASGGEATDSALSRRARFQELYQETSRTCASPAVWSSRMLMLTTASSSVTLSRKAACSTLRG